MHLWFEEIIEAQGVSLSFKIRQTLYQERSQYQEITVLETEKFGRMMVLDGCVMLTERDECLYHEMLVHPAVCSHPNPRNVLVIGGGDGGTIRELLRYPNIQVDLVELDEMVVRVSQEYFPTVSQGLTSPRVRLLFQDGIEFLKHQHNAYDLILIDSTDPVGPAEGLITQAFYRSCMQALRDPGAIVLQSGSPFFHRKELDTVLFNLAESFPTRLVYLAPVLTYPSGFWSFTYASKQLHPQHDFRPELSEHISQNLHYYNPEIHHAAFALPNFLKKRV